MTSQLYPRQAYHHGPLMSTVLDDDSIVDHRTSTDSGINSSSYVTSAARDVESSRSSVASSGDSMVNFGPESRLTSRRLPCYGQEAPPTPDRMTRRYHHQATVHRYKLPARGDLSTNSDTSFFMEMPLCNRGIVKVKSKISYKVIGHKLKKLTKKLQQRSCTKRTAATQ